MGPEGPPRNLTPRQPPPAVFPIAALAYLAVAHTAIVLVDVLDVGGSRERFIERFPTSAALWSLLFQQGSPTEVFQWALLAYLVVIAAVMGGSLRRAARRPSVGAFWTLIAVGAVLMLLEDAGDLRHSASDAMIRLFPSEGSWLSPLVQGIWFAIIAAVVAWAIIFHSRPVRNHPRFLRYGSAGVGIYALAAGMGQSDEVFHWYSSAGAFLEERVLRTSLRVPAGWTQEEMYTQLVDFVVEESLELLGASLLVAAAVSYWNNDGIVSRSGNGSVGS